MNARRPLTLAAAAATPAAVETGRSGQKAIPDSGSPRSRQKPADLRREAIRLQEAGYSTREIADRLGRSKSTVADYLRQPAPPPPVSLSLVAVGPESEADRIAREQREAAAHPAVRDPELLRGRLILYAFKVLRKLEERIDEANYRDLVGGMKIAAELAMALDRDRKDGADELAIPAGKIDQGAMLANLIAAGILDPEITAVEADGVGDAATAD